MGALQLGALTQEGAPLHRQQEDTVAALPFVVHWKKNQQSFNDTQSKPHYVRALLQLLTVSLIPVTTAPRLFSRGLFTG